uniref:Uncharacterized protein n=1 Tax=virus sp. ctML55 TaxID=2827627 RepID=A0A8S5RHD2_9VIRU|nr:MAG TPA: hypothetical protein [virus sp. ctML55]
MNTSKSKRIAFVFVNPGIGLIVVYLIKSSIIYTKISS